MRISRKLTKEHRLAAVDGFYPIVGKYLFHTRGGESVKTVYSSFLLYSSY